uniref:Uncharacterized protein n=1 Tax=Panagrolaimus sp. JU765 TaxID=591449 RepID=A0AC34RC55_9BILA
MKLKNVQFENVEEKLFMVINKVEQENGFYIQYSNYVLINGFKNVPAILDYYKDLESQNFFFAIVTNVAVFQDHFGGDPAERTILSKKNYNSFGFMQLTPTYNGTKRTSEKIIMYCPGDESRCLKRWICNNCFQFVGRV